MRAGHLLEAAAEHFSVGRGELANLHFLVHVNGSRPSAPMARPRVQATSAGGPRRATVSSLECLQSMWGGLRRLAHVLVRQACLWGIGVCTWLNGTDAHSTQVTDLSQANVLYR
jgi:hypothetical protein